MPARLISTGNGPSISLDKPIVLLGRQDECDVILESRKVSRKHCCLALINQTVLIRDLGSTNGISVNGKRVESATLSHGDIVSIGGHSFQLRWDSISGSQSRSPTPSSSASSDSGMDRPVPISDPSVKPLSSGGNRLAIA